MKNTALDLLIPQKHCECVYDLTLSLGQVASGSLKMLYEPLACKHMHLSYPTKPPPHSLPPSPPHPSLPHPSLPPLLSRDTGKWPTSWWWQVLVLTARNFRQSRHTIISKTNLFLTAALCIVCSLVWFQVCCPFFLSVLPLQWTFRMIIFVCIVQKVSLIRIKCPLLEVPRCFDPHSILTVPFLLLTDIHSLLSIRLGVRYANSCSDATSCVMSGHA